MTEAFRSIGDQLRFAIEKKHLIRVRYHDKLRLAEPHDYGLHNGKERVLVYQLQQLGASAAKGRATGWRLLDVSGIQDCVVEETRFPGSRGNQHRNHLEWETVYARVTLVAMAGALVGSYYR